MKEWNTVGAANTARCVLLLFIFIRF